MLASKHDLMIVTEVKLKKVDVAIAGLSRCGRTTDRSRPSPRNFEHGEE